MGETNALTTLGNVFTQIMSWMGSLVNTITSNEVLMLSTAIFVVGGVIGLATRLIRG